MHLALLGMVAMASAVYRPRQPEQGDLHHLVRDHFETFRAQAAAMRDGEGLPSFVEREFRDFLGCGSLAAGFARFRCARCRQERLVAFSCKGRGFCPSCGGRRMTERAAHLVDHVFPRVPVRQWVLSLPPRIRYALAWDHALCRAMVSVFMRAVAGSLRYRAGQVGAVDGRGGGVAIVQRFGAALNLNVHVHALIMDGVFVSEGDGVRFCPARPMRADEMATLLATIARRVWSALVRRGIADESDGIDTPDLWSDDAPVLAGLAAASVRGVRALGPRVGAPVRRWGDPIDAPEPPPLGVWHARLHGFDLHAGVVVPGGARERLEQVCRYALRPPLAQDRLQLMPDGQAVLELRRRWTDGTTHLIFDPVELLERLAALIPRPRINLVLYHGVLAPRAAWRGRIVPSKEVTDEAHTPCEHGASGVGRQPNRTWAELMQRGFGFDVLACPRCSGRLTLVALIRAPDVVGRILRHLHLPDAVPVMRPARDPPLPFDVIDEPQYRDDE